MKVYVCDICGYKYDESREKVLWKDLPDDWVCPLCGVGKDKFTLLKDTSETDAADSDTETDSVSDPHVVSDILAETMVNWGIRWVFGMLGHSNLGLGEAVRKEEARDRLRFISIRHEGAEELERCYSMGARGVGELVDKGWGFGSNEDNPLPRQERLHPNDARLDPFWEKCAELELPVNFHIADHPSCWQPLGPEWERTPDFQVFNLYGKDVPSYEELIEMRDEVLEKHRNTRFILCHFSNLGNDLGRLATDMVKHSNLYLDISARDYEIGRQPRSAREFIDRFSTRIMFGTDMGREQEMYEGWWRLLETADEFIPGRQWWRMYGLELDPDTLRDIYQTTAENTLNWK
jgi:predicted TIM-barrel fold metal-dependent hydrolase/rubredoxin